MIPFEVMLDVMEFSLDFAIVKMPDGRLRRQREGIPMGDPLSPGMTIATCAWMEKEWMQQLDARDKQRFVAKRFMDDILMIYAENDEWDYEKFEEDFRRSECYQEPLKLEEGTGGTFLETMRLTSATPEQNLGNTRHRGGFVWTTTRYADLCSNGYPEVTFLASSSSSTD